MTTPSRPAREVDFTERYARAHEEDLALAAQRRLAALPERDAEHARVQALLPAYEARKRWPIGGDLEDGYTARSQARERRARASSHFRVREVSFDDMPDPEDVDLVPEFLR